MEPRTERAREAFVRAALADTRFAAVRWVAETGSTNDDLSELARKGAGEQVLITDLQTAGKGRRNRVWTAPTGSGVLMSVLLRDVEPSDGFWSVGALALAASEAIGELIDVPCSLKWPNDVMVDTVNGQKKVAGVLAQLVDQAIVVGIGINANWPDRVPAEMAERGTAINRHTNDRTMSDRPALAADVLRRAIGHLDSERHVLRTAWKARCSTLGQHVRLELQAGAIIGTAVDIARDGALQLEDEDGISTHQVGDVVHLRPAT
ncbi:MAG: BirA family biotin operon repressor/biotin-[acetyl-CoA-carboxylase] ligase [Acidimicrobiales bacterium]|jgi:BirA family biotin operon repressor/biotin-[acetyl-CoA-carboxylase] ligase